MSSPNRRVLGSFFAVDGIAMKQILELVSRSKNAKMHGGVVAILGSVCLNSRDVLAGLVTPRPKAGDLSSFHSILSFDFLRRNVFSRPLCIFLLRCNSESLPLIFLTRRGFGRRRWSASVVRGKGAVRRDDARACLWSSRAD